MKKHTEFTFNLPALRIIENEHHLLRYLMSEWHPIVFNTCPANPFPVCKTIRR